MTSDEKSAKTQIAHYKTTVPILHTATKTNAAVIAQPSSLFETERSGHIPALNPHRPTPLPAQTPPAVSSLEAFRTPASENLITSVNGRRPKTLNRSGNRGPILYSALQVEVFNLKVAKAQSCLRDIDQMPSKATEVSKFSTALASFRGPNQAQFVEPFLA